MIIKFDKRYKRRTNGDNMSAVLDRIDGLSAEQILAYFGQADDITVDIFDVANRIGIEVVPVDFSQLEEDTGCQKDSILGAVIDNDNTNKLKILIKNNLGTDEIFHGKTEHEKETVLRRRQRFTVAHEIAHACIHLSEQQKKFKVDFRMELNSLSKEEAFDIREYKANVFAGELLIPEHSVKLVCEKLIYNSLNVLCEIFDVSHSVMSARLRHLGIEFVDDYKNA